VHVTRALRAREIVKSFEAGVQGCSASVRALAGASLDLLPGEHVALDGAAGSGKSTLLLILAGILRPDAGTVSWISQSRESLREPHGVEYLPSWRPVHALQSLRRALSSQPGLLLVDDILSALNSASKREAKFMIRELWTQRVTVLLASRHNADCASLCSRVVVLRSGRTDGRSAG
jgi:ABC-type multidrug transport system ATPase subunit